MEWHKKFGPAQNVLEPVKGWFMDEWTSFKKSKFLKEEGNSLADGECFLQANGHLDEILKTKVIEKSDI